MSILSTESFIAFGAVASTDDTFVAANNEIRLAHAANLRRAGYQVALGAQTGASNAQGFVVRPDPVNPERNALFFSAAATGGSAGIRKQLPLVNGEAIIGGFTLFIPGEYVKANAAVTTGYFRVIASGIGDALWTAAAGDTSSWTREVFRVSADLLINRNGSAPQSQKALAVGRVNFLEYRISPNDVRVWLDDVLVLQTAVALNVETIGFMFDALGVTSASSAMAGAPARWSIGNWYNLVEDAIAPNVRLGPTTRIIGVRPDVDVEADFLRPTGYASNAAVMAQNLVDAPTATLQSSNVGDQDIYASTKDTTTASGKLVHGVTMKVMASNLESNPHAIRPVIRAADGTESVTPKAREWRVNPTAISTKHLLSVARRPTDGKIFACGDSIALLTNTQNAAPGTPWTQISDDGGAVSYYAIAFRSDGWGVLGRSDGKLQFIAPGSDTPGPVTSAGTFSIVYHIAVLPDGRFAVSGLATTTTLWRVAFSPLPATSAPDVVANWTAVQSGFTNQGAGRMMAFSPTLGTGKGRIVLITDATGGGPNSIRSDDGGVTWTGVYNSNNVNHYAVVWDTNASVFASYFATGAAPPVRKSIDGITWTMPANVSTANGLVSGRAANVLFDPDNNNTTIVIGDLGSMIVTQNSTDFRPITRVTVQHLRGICKAANGDYIVVGFNGTVLAYTAGAPDGLMAPLGGYLPYTAVAPVNPVTGEAWTPADASVSQFGMRLTS